MKIVPIHYKKSKAVGAYRLIEQEAHAMAEMIDAKDFKGIHRASYAIAHCQVSDNPFAFFVLDKQLVKGSDVIKFREFLRNGIDVFEDRVIMNPQILESPLYVDDESKNDIVKKLYTGKSYNDGQELIAGKKPNSAQYMEGCMSFPYRKAKKINRFNKIKVSYYVMERGRERRKTRWLEGLPSQVFQHEFDHIQGQNIFFDGHKE